MRTAWICLCALITSVACSATSWARAAQLGSPQVNVILWFDTEDYLSPSDDDAARRLADLLTARQIRATFKLVGEKARVLEQRHRADVIEALSRHDIGFHGNFHSIHPTVSEYEADLGLLDGCTEFVRRESPGSIDVLRIFNRKTLACYGQPGSSWAVQAIVALPLCGIQNDGIPCYLDSGEHVGLGGAPFWYAGALNVYKMRPNETRMELFTTDGLEEGEKQFTSIANRLRSAGGGLISIFYHPCEWVTSEFWDGANFTHGANPPRDQWKLPAQRPANETDAAFVRFEKYVDYMRGQANVRFVSASELPSLYRDPLRTHGALLEEIRELSRRITSKSPQGLDDIVLNDVVYSPADQFELFCVLLNRLIGGAGVQPPAAIPVESLLGPDASPAVSGAALRVMWPAFASAVSDVGDFVKRNHRIPARVFIGADSVSPADFLLAMNSAYADFRNDNRFPGQVQLGRDVPVLTERFISRDDARLFSGWVIHKSGFRAPHIMDLARLQAWTFKPAVSSDSHTSGN
jgi:hypothetical protein